MSNSALLTVGIPTFNGAHRIHSTLDSIVRQLNDKTKGKFDIFISDNGSTDNTADVVERYQALRLINIGYSKNDSNLGFDKNVDFLFKKASGKFVWILADDDAMEEEAISNVIYLLDTTPGLKAVQVNFNSYDPRLENIVSQVNIPSDVHCHTAKEFLLNSKGRYGQVSTMVLNKEAWNGIKLADGMGSNYIHIYGLLKILLLGESYILKQPLVKARMGSENFGTSGDSLVLTPLRGGRLFAMMPKMGYDRDICQQLLNENRRYVFGTIKEAKRRGIKNKTVLIQELISVHNSLKLWIRWIPLILWPESLTYRKKRHPAQTDKS